MMNISSWHIERERERERERDSEREKYVAGGIKIDKYFIYIEPIFSHTLRIPRRRRTKHDVQEKL
jgi:hypothetical protein